MKLLFVTDYGYLPDVVGGLQTTIHELCLALVERGVVPAVLCGSVAVANPGIIGTKSDDFFGYQVIRTDNVQESLSIVAAALDTDAIIVLTGANTASMIITALDTGVPMGAYIHNVEFREFGGTLLPDPQIHYFSNSQFTRKRLRSLFGIESTVLLPLVSPENYQLDTHQREKVLFINPSQLKGIEIFIQAARQLPDIDFRVFESWNLSSVWRKYCHSRISDLTNIEWCSPTRDVTTLYGLARMLIMPSVWEESFGRSALEAHCSGIPVIASQRGGLPEAVGDGGIILEADADANEWVAAIQRLYRNQRFYDDLVDKAYANVSLVENTADYIVATLITAIRDHIFKTGEL